MRVIDLEYRHLLDRIFYGLFPVTAFENMAVKQATSNLIV
jgi:hypothetical protein